MTFTQEQTVELRLKLNASHVKQRTQAGRSLSYIEGWHAIAEANRIFGFDGWTRETVESRLVAERERMVGKPPNERTGWGVSYIARVKVVVFAGDTIVTREGIGAGHGIDADLGLAHESAVKESETDAMKRALMTFGNPFGLALYDKSHADVEAPQRPAQRQERIPVSSGPADESPDALKARMLGAVERAATLDELEALTTGQHWRAKFPLLPEAHRKLLNAAATKRYEDLARQKVPA